MKRLLAILLCLVMLFTLAPFSAFAAEGDQVDGAVTNEEQKTEFSVEKAYEEYSALETDELKEEYLSKLTEEQKKALLEYIDGLFDVEKAYEDYSALETDVDKQAFLAELTEAQQKELLDYIDSQKVKNEPETEEPKLLLALDGGSSNVSSFDELQTAISDASITTIVLSDSFSVTSKLTIGSKKNITLDFAGKTLTLTASDRAFTVNGTLTVQDSVGNGGIVDDSTLTEKTYGSLFYVSGGTLKINSGSYTRGTGDKGYQLIYATSSSKVTISGGTFSGVSGDNFVGTKTTNGIVGKSSSEFNINGGTFNKEPTAAYLSDGYFAFNNNDGTFSVYELIATVESEGTTTNYKSFTDAWKAVNVADKTSTLTLCKKKFSKSSVNTIDKNATVTFDLNGCSYINSSKTESTKTFYIKSGSFSVTDSVGGGSITGSSAYTASGSAVYVEGGIFNLTNGILNTGSENATNVIFCKSGTVNISGGTVNGKISRNASTGTVVISGGKFSDKPTSTYLINPGTATYSFDKKNSSDEYFMVKRVCTVEYAYNGTETRELIYADSLPAKQNFTDYIGEETYHSLRVSVPIYSGHIFDKWYTKAVTTETGGTYYSAGDTVPVTENIKLYAQWKDGTAESVAELGSNEYVTVSEAIYNATSENNTITLIKDDTENFTIPSEKSIILDLNGHSITNANSGSAVTNKGTLLIKGSGSIYGEAQSSGGGIDNSGSLTIEGGSISGIAPSNGGGIYNTGSVTMNGGTIDGTANQGGAVYTSKGTFIMNGGTVKGTFTQGGDGSSFYITNYSLSHLFINGENSTVEGTINTITEEGQIDYRKIVITQGKFTTFNPSPFVSLKSQVTGTSPDPYVVISKGISSYVISVFSRINGTDNTIAHVSGGGRIASIDSTELSATSVVGYDFKGWYTGYTTSAPGTLVSSDYCMLVSGLQADEKYYAVYEPKTGGETFSLTVNGSSFKIDDISHTEPTTINSLSASKEVTVEYTGTDTFLYWKNVSDKVVSTEKTYKFTMGSDVTLTAESAGSQTTTSLVVFRSYYGQIMHARHYAHSDTINIPTGPARLGHSFSKWVFSGTETEATKTAIQTKISESSGKEIYIEPLYTEIKDAFTVTVNNADTDGTVFDAQIYKSIRFGESVVLTAPVVADKKFLYWSDAASSGNILTYETSYTVRPTDNTFIFAIFGAKESNVTAGVCVNITDVRESALNDTTDRISFTEYYSVPDDYTVVKAGFIYKAVDDTTSGDILLESQGVYNSVSKLNGACGSYVLNLDIAKTTSKMIFVRGYVQYMKDSTVYTAYSDISLCDHTKSES